MKPIQLGLKNTGLKYGKICVKNIKEQLINMLLNILRKLSAKLDNFVWYLEMKERKKRNETHYKKK